MTPSGTPAALAAFVDAAARSQAAERANYQLFLNGLTDALGLPRPELTTGDPARDGYVFDRAVTMRDTAGGATGFADLYRRGAFVLETKQGADAAARGTRKAGHGTRGTPARERTLVAAKAQAQRYAQNLGADEPVPPFLWPADRVRRGCGPDFLAPLRPPTMEPPSRKGTGAPFVGLIGFES